MIPIRSCYLIVATVVLTACGASAAQTPTAPGPDALKQALNKRLVELKPDGMTERNVLFQAVTAGSGIDGTYPFKVTMTIRDYGAGYPANKYYGETCVAQITDGIYELSMDLRFNEWHAEGKMTPDFSQRQCKPNPSAGVSSMPLAGLAGTPAPVGVAVASVQTTGGVALATPVAGGGAMPSGAYQCWANGQARLLMNFTVTGAGTYKGSDNKPGTFTVDAGNRVTFKGGALDGAMPDGFFAVYHVEQGRPKVSFMSSTSGAEAAFCQK